MDRRVIVVAGKARRRSNSRSAIARRSNAASAGAGLRNGANVAGHGTRFPGVASSRFAGPGSLRQLLDAVMAIGSDLHLEATLRRIIEAARDLVDAQYGALGVLNPERTIRR